MYTGDLNVSVGSSLSSFEWIDFYFFNYLPSPGISSSVINVDSVKCLHTSAALVFSSMAGS